MWFLMYWYLPAFVISLVSILVHDKKLAVEDLFMTTVWSLAGWITILIMLSIAGSKYSHINILDFRKKK